MTTSRRGELRAIVALGQIAEEMWAVSEAATAAGDEDLGSQLDDLAAQVKRVAEDLDLDADEPDLEDEPKVAPRRPRRRTELLETHAEARARRGTGYYPTRGDPSAWIPRVVSVDNRGRKAAYLLQRGRSCRKS